MLVTTIYNFTDKVINLLSLFLVTLIKHLPLITDSPSSLAECLKFAANICISFFVFSGIVNKMTIILQSLRVQHSGVTCLPSIFPLCNLSFSPRDKFQTTLKTFSSCPLHLPRAPKDLEFSNLAQPSLFLSLSQEGPLYPFAKLNHVKIFGLFMRHE